MLSDNDILLSDAEGVGIEPYAGTSGIPLGCRAL